MKVATLTLPLHTNYGGIIQCYALQKIIQELGYETELLTIYFSVEKSTYKIYLKKIKHLFRYAVSFGKYIQKTPKTPKDINTESEKFISNEIIRSRNIIYKHQLYSTSAQKFDAYIVGSDQVWREIYIQNLNNYLFDFVGDEKLILSYAASFGVSDWQYNEQQTLDFKRLASRFTAISVREHSAVQLLKNQLNIVAHRTLDPTLLLDLSYYESIITRYSKSNIKNSCVFSYILDQNEEKENLILDIAEYLGTNSEIFNDGKKEHQKEGLGEWLNGIKNAKLVVTDSFHGVIFSILFNKQFIAIGNVNRGLSRFDSILKLFNLKDRLISRNEISMYELIENPINYKEVNEILEKEKFKSMEFLKNNLSQLKQS